MLKSALLYSLILCLSITSGQAQIMAKVDTLLIGTWKGTSICQIKNSPCHDETVVYHISKNMGVDTFYINASKIVNGVEEEMGILPFTYNKKTSQLVSTAYKGIWTFNIEGAKIEGTLVFRGNLYRIIKVVKQILINALCLRPTLGLLLCCRSGFFSFFKYHSYTIKSSVHKS